MTPAWKTTASLPNPAIPAEIAQTHVVFTLNTSTPVADGVARLYLDGVPAESIAVPRPSPGIRYRAPILSVGYVGLWDGVAVFNRALTPGEIQACTNCPAASGISRALSAVERRYTAVPAAWAL